MVENRIDELRRRLERDPGSRLFAQLAEEHRKAGEHAEAIRVARAGLAFHPSYASARLTLGRALLESGEPGAAAAELAQVVREAPDNILAGRFLGQALEASGDVAGALQQYGATLKMAPGDRQLEGQIAALRASVAARPAGPVPRAAAAVPPPPPTSPMAMPPATASAPQAAAPRPAAPPLPPLLSRPASAPAAVPPTIRLASPPDVAPPAAAAGPAAARPAAAPREDVAERTLMYVPEPTLNVRVE
ncbi:MAG: tetratricopeptide repeat protein [Vicinamibacteria bacterium]